MGRFAVTLLVGCAAFAAAPVLAQSEAAVNERADMLFGDHEALRAAFDVVQDAVADENAEALAALVKYPFATVLEGEDYVIESEDDFVTVYPDLITDTVADAVLSQDYANLFLNQDGAMFGQGEMWLTPICTDEACSSSHWLISGINN